MTLAEIKTYFHEELSNLFERRELDSLWRIFKEDHLSHISEGFQSSIELIVAQIERIKSGEPIQYVVENANFYGYNMYVNNHVLIPRPETEELVDWVFSEVKEREEGIDILDIGTGSGCIINSLASLHPRHNYHAIDISNEALSVAMRNSSTLGTKVAFQQLDFTDTSLWDSLGRFDILVSNPPYVSASEEDQVSPSALTYEPEMAIFSGNSPFVFYDLIERFARIHLAETGSIFLELNEFVALEIAKIYASKNWKTELRKDLQGKYRMLKAWC